MEGFMGKDSSNTPKVFLLDVDGVMTTGQFSYTAEGKSMKVFGPDDNDALSLLRNLMEIRFITGDKNGLEITARRIAKTWFIEEDKSKYFYLCEDAGKATSIAAADNALIAMKNWTGLENLKNIKNPTLIIWGDQDKAYNFDQVDTLNKNIPNSELKIIEGCSHNVHLEKPDEFNEVVKYFLAEAFKL